MSPVTLHLEYFGPYRDETIDFTKFAATPLFLISGKTGSGKTTIFDGMCYALFNQTSGVDREAKSMRSDFATMTDTTRVTFTFTHRDRRYEIVREPSQILAKKRGTGVHEATASVTLTVFAGEDEVTQLTKEGQVRDYLQELLQMDGKQFAQIVLLPQGQFRKFLIAPSEDKAAVLEQLFNTTIFARWTDQLKRQLKQNEAANRQTAATQDRLLDELKWTPVNQERAQALLANHQTPDLLTLMASQQTTTQQDVAAVQATLQTADHRHSELVRQDEQERLFLQDQQQLAQQRTAQKALTAQQPAMDQLQQRIAELEWTQQLQPQWQQRTRATQTVAQRQQQYQQAQQALSQAQAQLATAQADLKSQQPLVAKLKQANTTLAQQQALVPVYQRVTELKQANQQAQTAVEQATRSVTSSQTAVTANQAAQKKHQQVIDRQTEIYATQSALTKRQATLEQQQQQLTTLQETTRKQADLEQRQQDLTAQATAATATATQQRALAEAKNQEFLRHQIVLLSAQLTEGSPCPVCGSVHHPHPAATTGAAAISEDEVKRLAAEAQQREQQATQLTTELKSAQQQLVEQQAVVQKGLTTLRQTMAQPETAALAQLASAYQDAVTAYQADVAQNRQQLTDLQAAQAALTELQTTAQTLTEQLTAATTAVKNRQATADKLATELATETKRLPVDAPTVADFDQQLTALTQQIKQDQQTWDDANAAVQQAKQQVEVRQAQVTQAHQEFDTSQADLATAQAAVHEQLVAQFQAVGDDQEALVTAAIAELPTLATKRQTLQDFQQQQAQLATSIATLVKRTQGKPTPQREQTQAQLVAAKAQVTDLQEQQRQLQNLADYNAERVTQLKQLIADQAATLKQTQELTELSGVVNGDGPNSKLGLERYVLQTYLRQILTVGNHRLKQLTNGRYQFVIDEAQANSKKRSGLEINVYDDHVGEQRSVHTLSGGESFIASLALALALGEVIQQTTGSVDVDALFIDEGFGSLDEDALMTALESLETIEGKHRMIGIISHVSELRDQVENQLQVVANGNGESTIRYHAAE
ncbi:AAA family ATPase [Levilactobacillus suantsaiihabitans]|uniref:Nuclease SbcCD subunit C n=1 Tax=Levilactobacillus suantsaiihabitans TaxID=2487722 RepID=A0A4Z0JBX7_9LACO|nr:SMC family ATPase [Levilactobacillus suantsaiihabitans]TGD20331.1 SMC family ATPase [Levilactobacillus suantsaiihabitans]